MNDGDTRVVTAPASKATGYGIDAAIKSAARAVGEAVDFVIEAVVDNIGLHAAAKKEPAPAWVVEARVIWARMARSDDSLRPVVLADLSWYASFAGKVWGKPAVGELDKVNFGAWTNSSSLVLVDESLFGLGPEVAAILLDHEAQHVRQFRANKNTPPTSYLAMARFEVTAYSRTRAKLTPLKAQDATYESVWKSMDHLVKFFEHASGLSSDAGIRQAMLDYEDFEGDKSPLLPPSTGDTPSSLYVP